jgi:hypothetical protein
VELESLLRVLQSAHPNEEDRLFNLSKFDGMRDHSIYYSEVFARLAYFVQEDQQWISSSGFTVQDAHKLSKA